MANFLSFSSEFHFLQVDAQNIFIFRNTLLLFIIVIILGILGYKTPSYQTQKLRPAGLRTVGLVQIYVTPLSGFLKNKNPIVITWNYNHLQWWKNSAFCVSVIDDYVIGEIFYASH